MKCIDVIEGTAKSIIDQMHAVCMDHCLDDSEYVRNAKAIIDGTKRFLSQNPEVVAEPQLLLDVLYAYSRGLWLTRPQPTDAPPSSKSESSDDSEEYQTYYYDYLYQRGVYPL
ncbi:hypothetical protein [Desulfatitalea alkaliphila]|uniref:Uncharacterized protein n=1 Tax=Desulfatitalea alkaliphila TaxID=2929485 RepID=A0AA41R1H6_9BACT|nr:hypothetical protein [Desulfatitalea alkaliphila]MCJ8499971.1 hypothetical protein [Desulfatitalea alkaliphila]